jgi:nicotinamide-nucleotide amidase
VQAAILTTGTELTRGELVNGNAAWLSERLTGLGIDVIEHATVPDDSARIANTLARFAREVKLVVCTGGLGPTSDDLTAQTVGRLLGVPLVRDAHTLARIAERYRKFHGLELRGLELRGLGREQLDPTELPETLKKQADVPEGAQVLDNDAGVAAGFAISIGSTRCYFLPGVPREMTHLFERHLEPAIGLRIERTSAQVHIRVFGLGESQVAERLADLEVGGALHRPGISFGYRAHFPETEVKVLARVAANVTGSATASAPDIAELEAKRLANAVAEQARARLAPYAYGGREDSYPAHVGGLLRSRGLKLALAESCTGGLTAKLLTDIPGSSDFFQLSVVTYADAAKRDLLGVSASLLERHGAVSSEVAAAMAEGVLTRGHSQTDAAEADAGAADIGAAITGIAGPGGGSAEKPVGTVWFAVSRRNSTHGFTTRTERRTWPGDRESVRTWAAYCALQLIAQAATSQAPLPGTSSGTSSGTS